MNVNAGDFGRSMAVNVAAFRKVGVGANRVDFDVQADSARKTNRLTANGAKDFPFLPIS